MLEYLNTFNCLADHLEDFTLDAVDNHASVKTDETANAQNETTAYGASALADAAGYTLTYNTWNRMVKSTNGAFVRTLTLTYDAWNRMATDSNTTMTLRYDALGRWDAQNREHVIRLRYASSR